MSPACAITRNSEGTTISTVNWNLMEDIKGRQLVPKVSLHKDKARANRRSPKLSPFTPFPYLVDVVISQKVPKSLKNGPSSVYIPTSFVRACPKCQRGVLQSSILLGNVPARIALGRFRPSGFGFFAGVIQKTRAKCDKETHKSQRKKNPGKKKVPECRRYK